MSEQPTRTLGAGLAPRRSGGGVQDMDASRLLRSRRSDTATELAATIPATAAATKPAPAPAPAAARAQLNVSVPHDLRARARAAYRATAHLEGHQTFQDFITDALETEVRRLEDTHNGGARYTGGDQPLPAGRPLGS